MPSAAKVWCATRAAVSCYGPAWLSPERCCWGTTAALCTACRPFHRSTALGRRSGTCWSSPSHRAESLLLTSELVDIDVADAEHLRATGQVLHVALVHLFGLQRDRLIFVRLQRGRPDVQGFRIVRLQ